MPKLPSLEKTV